VYSRGLMKLPLRAITLILLLLAATGTASASGVTLTLNNGGSDVMGGVYVGPYNFTETGNGSPVSLGLICDDYTDEVWLGESWTANLTKMPLTSSSLSGLYFGGTNGAGTAYLEAAWLAQQIFALGPANASNSATIGYMQYAIWDLFSPGASSGLSASQQSMVSYWLTQAADNYNCATCNYSDVVIYTPSSLGVPEGTQPQEYIGIITTPEPSALMLLSAGLLGLLGFRRRLSY